MTTTDNINAVDPLANYQSQGVMPQAADNDVLGKNQFLELMIAQLQHQDPLSPQSNSEFVAQLAQFSSVEGLENLNNSVASMSTQLSSSQALQASTLVGQTVSVPGNQAPLNKEGELTGTIVLPVATTSMSIDILDENGQLVQTLEFSDQQAGEIPFTWDGKDASGNTIEPGFYTISPKAIMGGQDAALYSYMAAKVESVTLDHSFGLKINLTDMGSVSLSDIHQVFE